MTRMLNIDDDVTRECLATVINTSISGWRVVPKLGDLIARRGAPKMFISNNIPRAYGFSRKKGGGHFISQRGKS